MDEILLRTKLRPPPPRGDLLARPGLIERLERGRRAGQRLTLLSAPAGSGKSTLLGAWLEQAQAGTAWLSLDADDDDPVRFWTYLLAALQRARPGFGETAAQVLRAPQRPSWSVWLDALIDEWDGAARAHGGEPLILALDDLHLVRDPAIHEGLAFLVEHAPPDLHLAVSTRADPPLPLARMRVRRQLGEVRDADLRFTAEEATALLAEGGVQLDAAQVARLQERTEGWIAGIQLAALSLQGREQVDDFLDAFSGSHQHVLDYLVTEVLEGLPAGTQRFLLETSVLGRFDAALADAVRDADDGAETLLRLLRDNVFVVALDHERRWVRYHHLFADLLRSRLQAEDPGRVKTLRGRAARECLERGLHADAHGHAVAAGDLALAGDVARAAAFELMTDGQLMTLKRWLDALPDVEVEARPWLLILRAWTMLFTGRAQEAPAVLAIAERRAGEGHRDADDPELQGNLDILRAILANAAGASEQALQLARRAGERLPADCLVLRIMVPQITGYASRAEGDLVASLAAFREIERIGTDAGSRWTECLALCDQGQIALVEGRLHDARALYRRAAERADVPGLRDTVMGAIVDLGRAWVAHAAGDEPTAAALVERALPRLMPGANPDQILFGLAIQAQVAEARGDDAAAAQAYARGERIRREAPGATRLFGAILDAPLVRHWIAAGDVARAAAFAGETDLGGDAPPLVREGIGLVRARLALATDGPAAAVAVLQPLLEQAEHRGRLGRAALARALLARAHLAAGEPPLAAAALAPAIRWAEEQDALQLLRDEGEPVRSLLDDEGRPDEGAARRAAANAALAEPLSERELEVLDLLAEGLSNRQIGQRLFVSLGTVKTHVHHISAKLDADSRTHAVALARERGLLP